MEHATSKRKLSYDSDDVFYDNVSFSLRLPFSSRRIILSSYTKPILDDDRWDITIPYIYLYTYILELDMLVPRRCSEIWQPLAVTARTHATQLSRVWRCWCNGDVPRQPINTWPFADSTAKLHARFAKVHRVHPCDLRACSCKSKIQFV